jgi:hypothetical protein
LRNILPVSSEWKKEEAVCFSEKLQTTWCHIPEDQLFNVVYIINNNNLRKTAFMEKVFLVAETEGPPLIKKSVI